MRLHSMIASGTAIGSSKFRTLTPFLYQTKTLLSAQWFPKPSLRNLQSAAAHSRQFLHNSSIPITKVVASSKLSRQPYNSSNIHNEDAKSKEESNVDHIPWEGGSGMKDIQVERNPFVTRVGKLSSSDDGDLEDLRHLDSSNNFAIEDKLDENQEESEISTVSTSHPSRESTITATEKEAFNRIFGEVKARRKSVGVYSTPPSSSQSHNHASFVVNQSDKERKTGDSVRITMKGASNFISGPENNSIKLKSRDRSSEELRAHVDEYPLPLRAAAAKALGLALEISDEILEEEIISNADELETTRQPERERMERLMRSAKTDIELWQVMENEVFELVEKLGLQDKPKVHAETSEPRTRRRTKDVSKAAREKAPNIAKSDQPLDLNIYGPLYPSYILLGLRLLDRSFTNPSPLVLNLLPRIKSLGIVSHVLGASTPFYNELLRIHWTRYDDFIGVLDLLKEMEQAGLEFDEESLGIINEIHQAQLQVRKGKRGSALQALWSLPEFAPGKFKRWEERIQASIDEKAMEIGD